MFRSSRPLPWPWACGLRVPKAVVRPALWAASALALSACVSAPGPRVDEVPDAQGWQDVALPGKARTHYRWEQQGARRELVAQADASASMFRRALHKPASALREVEFAWWVQALPEGGDASAPGRTDAAARVMFAFDGDSGQLSQTNRIMFDLARTLTGEVPPYATLVYIWDASAPVGSVIVHPRNDRVRKIVVESGHGALRQWRRYRRSLVDDYRLAFGEAPGPLLAVAVMTDGDNTRSRLTTRYSDIEFR